MVERSYVVGTWQKERSFSPAVITKGGSRTVWLAGHAASMDKHGKPFKGDFAAQVRRTFEYMQETMAEAGGTLDDIVTICPKKLRGRTPDEGKTLSRDEILQRFPETLMFNDSKIRARDE